MLTKYIYCYLIVLVATGSCKNRTPEVPIVEACGVQDPVRNLPWLKNKIEEAKANKTDRFLKVVMLHIGGKQIINYQLEYMACIGCYAYNCDGTPFDVLSLPEEERNAFSLSLNGEIGPEKLSGRKTKPAETKRGS